MTSTCTARDCSQVLLFGFISLKGKIFATTPSRDTACVKGICEKGKSKLDSCYWYFVAGTGNLFVTEWFDDFVLAPCALELLNILSLDPLVYKMLQRKTNALETNEYHGVFLCVSFERLVTLVYVLSYIAVILLTFFFLSQLSKKLMISVNVV